MSNAFLITARLKSTRLAKKIILEVLKKPLIVHMIDRIKFAKNIDKIIICTSTNVQDNLLEEIAIPYKVFPIDITKEEDIEYEFCYGEEIASERLGGNTTFKFSDLYGENAMNSIVLVIEMSAVW